MSENKKPAGSADQQSDTLWAKIGDGRWYAIPANMAESFRKAGADVRRADELPQ